MTASAHVPLPGPGCASARTPTEHICQCDDPAMRRSQCVIVQWRCLNQCDSVVNSNAHHWSRVNAKNWRANVLTGGTAWLWRCPVTALSHTVAIFCRSPAAVRALMDVWCWYAERDERNTKHYRKYSNKRHPPGGVTNLVSPVRWYNFLRFLINAVYLLDITFISDRCYHSWAAVTPVKFECNSYLSYFYKKRRSVQLT